MAMLIRNAAEILTMKHGWEVLHNASIFVDRGKIKKIGRIKNLPKKIKIVDASRCTVLPGFVDSHTHLVFAGSREDEFAMRVKGATYQEIARAGGGIQSSVRKMLRTSENALYDIGIARLAQVARHGTTTIEIKSGYGLYPAQEIKMLRAIKRMSAVSDLDIVPTYLVHAIPPGTTRHTYVQQVINKIIPKVVQENLAVFCDVFCDTLAFTVTESRRILNTAQKAGLRLKLHADQFADVGGADLAARMGCVSVDHLEYTPARVVQSLKYANVVPVILPGVTLYLNMKKIPPVHIFKRNGVGCAIASDFNPGSCTIYAMEKIVSLACLLYKMPVEDALAGATIHGARALGMEDRVGSLELGKQADMVICNVDNYKKIPYYFGEDVVKYTIKKGRVIYGKNS